MLAGSNNMRIRALVHEKVLRNVSTKIGEATCFRFQLVDVCIRKSSSGVSCELINKTFVGLTWRLDDCYHSNLNFIGHRNDRISTSSKPTLLGRIFIFTMSSFSFKQSLQDVTKTGHTNHSLIIFKSTRTQDDSSFHLFVVHCHLKCHHFDYHDEKLEKNVLPKLLYSSLGLDLNTEALSDKRFPRSNQIKDSLADDDRNIISTYKGK